MTEEEIKELKMQIKKEIINELTKKDYVKENMWRNIKKDYEIKFKEKGFKTNYDLGILFSGIQTIIRTSMGYRSVELIPKEEESKVRDIMEIIYSFYPEKRTV